MNELLENLRVVSDVTEGRVAATAEQRTDLARRMVVIHERLARETPLTARAAAALGIKHLLVICEGQPVFVPQAIAAAYFRMIVTEVRVFGARVSLGTFDAIARRDIALRKMACSADLAGEI